MPGYRVQNWQLARKPGGQGAAAMDYGQLIRAVAVEVGESLAAWLAASPQQRPTRDWHDGYLEGLRKATDIVRGLFGGDTDGIRVWPVLAMGSGHSPDESCTCGYRGEKRCGYRYVADTIIDELNPPDDDAAESWVVAQAVIRVAAYVASLPCACTPEDVADLEPCPRCAAIGRLGDKPIQR